MQDLTAFANRLKKTAKHRRGWAQRSQVEAYRLYDFDIPEHRYIVDRFADHAVVYDKRGTQEKDDPTTEAALLQITADSLGIPLNHVHLKQRRKAQEKHLGAGQGSSAIKIVVQEESSRYLVDMTHDLDTGLPLDHRPLRSRFRQLQPGLKFLNLFAKSGSASIAASASGATTVSVDISDANIAWATENFKLNNLTLASHRLVRTDVLKFLESGPTEKANFDVIFLDSPNFSNSQKMAQSFDLKRDHRRLLGWAMKFLSPQGVLYFSTSRQHFALDDALFNTFEVKAITLDTIPEDFRDQTIHQCFTLRLKPEGSTAE